MSRPAEAPVLSLFTSGLVGDVALPADIEAIGLALESGSLTAIAMHVFKPSAWPRAVEGMGRVRQGAP